MTRPGVNVLQDAFETDNAPITQTSSGGGLRCMQDEIQPNT